MEIIKHGKNYEAPQVKVCPDCECVFTYVEKDIKQNWIRKNAYDSDLLYNYINCPECGKTIIIKDYLEYKIYKVMRLWITRDLNGKLTLHTQKPHCPFYTWYSDDEVALNEELFPEVTFENSPQQVELKLIEK